MSPMKKQFSGPVRVPVQKPVKLPPPPPVADDDDDDDDDERLIHNIEQPGWTDVVDGAKYDAMQAALLRVVPSAQPGLTQAEVFQKVLRHLPATLFPGGAKAQWWAKTVYLDLEYKKVLTRTTAETPERWFRTAPVTIVTPDLKAPWDLDEDPGARKRPHRHERKGVADPEPVKAPRRGPPKGKSNGFKGAGKGGPKSGPTSGPKSGGFKKSGPPRGADGPPPRAPKRPKGRQ